MLKLGTGEEKRNAMAADDLLMRAIAAIKHGDKETGKRLLAQILQADPRNEIAWLCMTQAVDDAAQRRECLGRVLSINPNNQAALRMLTTSDVPRRPKAAKKKTQRKAKQLQRNRLCGVLLAFCAVAVFGCCVLATQGKSRHPAEETQPTEAPRSTEIPRPTKTPRPDIGGDTMAYFMCQDFIEPRLVAPTTAKFPSSSEVSIVRLSDQQEEAYQIIGYVDAQNKFGAMIRTYYICEITYLGNDRWSLEALDFGD